MTGRADTLDILVIAHIERPAMTVLEERITRAGRTLRLVRPVLGEELPGPRDAAAVVVLGGPMSAWDTAEYPGLAAETAFLAEAHRAGVPILGICLGSHLLSVALGGEAMPGPSGLECGLVEVTAQPGAGADAAIPLAGTHFSFHSDTTTLPPGASELAATDRYVQGWRLGGALGVQFHPELDPAGIDELLAIEEDKLARFGVDVAALRREVAALADDPADPTPGARLIDAWLGCLPAGA